MKTNELLNKIQGLQTLESIKSTFNINRTRAVYLVHRLRKKGYIKTKYDSNKKRIYYISKANALGGTSYIDMLNKYSPVKLSSSEVYRIYGRPPSIEETLVYAIKTKSLRYISAGLSLFRKIKNWNELYRLAKQEDILREMGALYDLALIKVRKIRRMSRRFRNKAMPKRNDRYLYIIDKLKSDDYSKIEERWKVYLPFNHKDLEDYKW